MFIRNKNSRKPLKKNIISTSLNIGNQPTKGPKWKKRVVDSTRTVYKIRFSNGYDVEPHIGKVFQTSH